MIGDTYKSHAEIGGHVPPTRPGIFFKMSQVVIGADDPIIYLKNLNLMDYEYHIVICE